MSRDIMVDYEPRLLPNNGKETYFWRNGERWVNGFNGQKERLSKDQGIYSSAEVRAREESKLAPEWLTRVWFPWATPGTVQSMDLDHCRRRIVVNTDVNTRTWRYYDYDNQGRIESYIEQRPAPPVPPFDPLCAYPLKFQEAEPEGREADADYPNEELF